MIKFFRKIRQSLLSEGKFTQYLKYAVGEVILVSVGILIAFQVNQWNEKQKDKELEHNLLMDVIEGLQVDLLSINACLQMQVQINNSQNIFIGWLDSDLPYHDTISVHLATASFYSDFLVHQGAYETLKQFGMRSIRNDSLRKQITYLYEVVYVEYLDMLETYRHNMVMTRPHIDHHVNEMSWNPQQPIIIHDLAKMKADNELRFNYGTLQNIGETLPLWRTPKTMAEIEKTINMINQELNQDQ